MSIPFSAAANAYGNVSKLISEQAKGGMPAQQTQVSGGDFAQMVAAQLENVTEAGKVSDQASMNLVNGQANVVDVVTALAETESAMETLVTVRDRVISAYEEIMRMPI